MRKLHTMRGIGSCIPLRDHPHNPADRDTDRVDRHGGVRCLGCGGPARVLNVDTSVYPVVFYECMLPITDGCIGRKRIACSTDWRRLGPLMQTDPLYHELRSSHSMYERVHHHMRARYGIAGNNPMTRQKRIGQGCRQLRAHAAVFVEWLRICHRQAGCPDRTRSR